MIRVLLFLAVFFVAASQVSAQDRLPQRFFLTGYHPAETMPEQIKIRCFATRCGTYTMIGGAAIAAVGGLALVTPYAKNNDPDKTGSGVKNASSVVAGGLSVAIVGIVLHVVGQEHDNNAMKRLKLEAKKNSVGFAWVF